MKKRTVLFWGVLIAGSVAVYQMMRKHTLQQKPATILALAKQRFTQEGPIEGGWIAHRPVLALRDNSEMLVYYGGVSRYERGKLVSYEFIAVATSGEILEFYPLPL